jgi:calreticulin
MFKCTFAVVLLCALVGASMAEVYFEDDFSQGSFGDRWVESTHKGSDAGKWVQTAGKYPGDEAADVGIQTSEDLRFYQLSAEIDNEFSNKDKTLVLQYSVRHEQKIDCGGAYVKLLPAGLDQQDFNGDSEYSIMFGPDICGTGTRKVHVILNYKGENHLIKRNIQCKTDEDNHVYTLIIEPDQTWRVLIDNEEAAAGDFEEWDFLPSKTIKDPSVSKPDDWDDDEEIDDPEDSKPSDWDDVPAQIVDPDAEKPDDWDDELDGEWEAPLIDNPEHQGEWSPRRIANPSYKGPWTHPEIDNPDYEADDSIYAFASHKYVGIEIWQVKAGTIFDNFLVTDDPDVAFERAAVAIEHAQAGAAAKAAADQAASIKAAEEARLADEEAAAAQGDYDDDDDDDDQDEEADQDEFDEDDEDDEEEEEEEEEEE